MGKVECRAARAIGEKTLNMKIVRYIKIKKRTNCEQKKKSGAYHCRIQNF